MIKFHEKGNALGVFSFTYFYSFIFFVYFYMWRNNVQINLRRNLFPQNSINIALRSRPCLPCHSRSYIKSILWSLYMCLNIWSFNFLLRSLINEYHSWVNDNTFFLLYSSKIKIGSCRLPQRPFWSRILRVT